MAKKELNTKERIIEAANRLFYAEGIRAVSVDAIAAKAGITKKSLYYHFKSKDELMAAYLVSRDQPNMEVMRGWFEAAEGDAGARVMALFAGIERAAKHPKWRGCGFLRTAGELANMPGHPAIKAGSAHKKRLEAWLADEFEMAGIVSAQSLARQVVLLLDGAFAIMMVHHDPAYISEAGAAARQLVDMQLNGLR